LTFCNAENFRITVSFALIIGSESQSKAEFDLQSLGKNKTGCCAKNMLKTNLFPRMKTYRKVNFFALLFYTPVIIALQCQFATKQL